MGMLFDIVDRMQSTSYGGLSVVMGQGVTSLARTRKLRAALELADSSEGFGPLGRRHRYRGSEACSWSNEITEMLRVPRRLFDRWSQDWRKNERFGSSAIRAFGGCLGTERR